MPRKKRDPNSTRVEGYKLRSHPLYGTWANMLRRCESHEAYTSKNIQVSKRWKASFVNFFNDMGPKPSPAHSIERVNNNGNYTKSNCIWATKQQQVLNRGLNKNNSSGHTGVVRFGGKYKALVCFNYKSHVVGSFKKVRDAKKARHEFIELAKIDIDLAVKFAKRIHVATIRCDSSSPEKYIRKQGSGFIVRLTFNNVRHYVGFFKDIEHAKRARDRFIEEATDETQNRVQRRNAAYRGG